MTNNLLMISLVSLLLSLLSEAERNNPQIQAAQHGWDLAEKLATQVCMARRASVFCDRSHSHP